MKIGIDISQIVYKGTGVANYTQELVKALLTNDSTNEYTLFGSSLRQKNVLEKFSNSLKQKYHKSFVSFPPSFLEILWNSLHVLPIEQFTGKLDVFHSSDWTQPPSSAKKVTTI